MTCPVCKIENPPSAKRCDCGNPLGSIEPGRRRCPYCAESILGAAKYCRYCHRNLGTKLSTWLIGAVALFVITLCLVGYLARVNMPYTMSQIEAGTYGAVVTMADFERIRTGMTYPQVTSIIGNDGVNIGQSRVAGYEASSYTWKNRDGSNLIAIFQDGRLVNKAQFGLR